MKQPMKGVKLEEQDEHRLIFPLYASIKLDGIRGVIKDGVVLSASMKPIPNKYIQNILGYKKFEGLDGEFIVPGNFQAQSAIMTREGGPDFTFWVFDLWALSDSVFEQRLIFMDRYCQNLHPRVRILRQVFCENLEQFHKFKNKALAEGHEGIMTRRADGLYKYGKSTLTEQYLLKVKPFEDMEAVITGFEEAMENTNEATISETGKTKRSSHKAGKVPKGTVGNFLVQNSTFGNFTVGPGEADHALRKRMWDNPSRYIGKTIVFKYQRIGTMDKPRSPIFKGFRHPLDMTE
jgi:DNA ligase-1